VRSYLRNNASFLLVISLAYCLVGGLFLFFYRYQINPDGISYINIARLYFSGDWALAVNGFWGPLISWLLAPFCGLKNPLHIQWAAKVILLVVGLGAILAAHLLCLRLEISPGSCRVVVAALVPVVVFFALSKITPDLLVVSILLFYFYIVVDPDFPQKPVAGIVAGLLGGAGYLAKSYVFPFFLFHFHGMLILHYLNSPNELRMKILRQWLLGAAAFAIISGPWIAFISSKYQKPTIGTAGAYNYRLMGPNSGGFPVSARIIAPPHDRSLSGWDDPSYIELEDWFSMKFLLNNTLRNIEKTHRRLDSLNLNIPIAVGLLLVAIFSRTRRRKFHAAASLFSILLYCGGYTFVWVDRRYLWPAYVLLFLAGFLLVEHIGRSMPRTRRQWRMLLLYGLPLLLIVSFVFRPLKELASSVTDNPDKYEYLLSRRLLQSGIDGNLATNGHWNRTLYLAYYLNARFYGTVADAGDAETRNEQLRKHGIRYYFVWDDRPGVSDSFSPVVISEPDSLGSPGLKIYSATPLSIPPNGK